MTRTCLFLADRQLEQLKSLSAKSGISVSELARRFIDKGLAEATLTEVKVKTVLRRRQR